MQVQATGNTVGLTVTQTATAARGAEAAQRPVFPPVSEGHAATSVEKGKNANSQESVEAATKRLQSFVSGVRDDIQFSMDQDSGRTVVKVIDSNTKEVIRQFPSEEAIELAKALDRFQGLLVKQQA